ncbi:DinB family protein [Halalkalibacter akibai]|uniref:DinB-like domain-containing protein n=1 Tax=Halalkalibacter akibai (strain ATCC 43226 / DSM 21942 / CIP 109018 / JCM 9157 / 1139) TaxID=1236973 RepID=W4QX94_HALA3|nr:DinB family protein [Halalkalibacter akibai]GAE36755.1 hypothetical protein JCM9157_3973 [Halalkalibacter akibai JCM 9157]
MAVKAFSFARFANISGLQAATPEQLDTVPVGFSNSIRWNAGHVLVIAESILRHSEKYEPVLPSNYKDFFFMGTSPADWKDEPPSVSELEELSAKQVQAVQDLVENHLDSPLKKAFEIRGRSFDTVSELVSFISYHEGLHFATIKALLKATK